MSQEITYYKHPITSEIKTLHGTKFNKDLFLLGIIYLLREGDYKNAALLSSMIFVPLLFVLTIAPDILLVAVLYSLVVLWTMAREYNEVRAEELLTQGYQKM